MGKSLGKCLLGRLIRKWKDNIKLYLKDVSYAQRLRVHWFRVKWND
jgi:hypothetical protein